MKAFLFILILSLTTISVPARMYQWVDPDSNTTQLSGKPPMWYRSKDSGSRVLVFENGKLIDDTGIVVSGEEGERLRNQALLVAEQDQQEVMQKLIESELLKSAIAIQQKDMEPVDEKTELDTIDVQNEAESSEKKQPGPKVDELRALVEQFEQMRTQSAKDLVNSSIQNMLPGGQKVDPDSIR